MYAATYQLEFREVLVLFAETRRRERQQRAEAIEAQALSIYAQHLLTGAASPEAGRRANELVAQLRRDARRLREPEVRLARVLTPAQARFMDGRKLEGV